MNFYNDIIETNFMKEKYEVTASPKSKRFYIKSSFKKILNGALIIGINPENPKELKLEEKPGQTRHTGFYSGKSIVQIANEVGTNGKMTFYFMQGKNSDEWKGILLPDFQKSYLWDNMKTCNAYADKNKDDQDMIQWLKYYYRKYVDLDEIIQYYNIAKCMAESTHDESETIKKFIWIYARALLEQLRLAERRNVTTFSYDRTIRTDSTKPTSFLDIMGQEDVRFRNIEAEEFFNMLTKQEKYVLKNLVKRADSGELTNCKCNYAKEHWKEICSLRQKVKIYYGTSTIKSYFQHNDVDKL